MSYIANLWLCALDVCKVIYMCVRERERESLKKAMLKIRFVHICLNMLPSLDKVIIIIIIIIKLEGCPGTTRARMTLTFELPE